MASITDKKGINVTSGFKLLSRQPIDARFVVEDETELATIISSGSVYNGLHVWVNSLNKEQVYNGTEFVDVGGGSGIVSVTISESQITSMDEETGSMTGSLTQEQWDTLVNNIENVVVSIATGPDFTILLRPQQIVKDETTGQITTVYFQLNDNDYYMYVTANSNLTFSITQGDFTILNYIQQDDRSAVSSGAVYTALQTKQDTLTSGTNIKTINNQSLLGSGNIEISGGSNITVDTTMSGSSTNPVQNKVITTEILALQLALGSKANVSYVDEKVADAINSLPSGGGTNNYNIVYEQVAVKEKTVWEDGSYVYYAFNNTEVQSLKPYSAFLIVNGLSFNLFSFPVLFSASSDVEKIVPFNCVLPVRLSATSVITAYVEVQIICQNNTNFMIIVQATDLQLNNITSQLASLLGNLILIKPVITTS